MSAQKPMISPYEVNELTKYCLKILTYTDARGVELDYVVEQRKEAIPGKNVMLSLDVNGMIAPTAVPRITINLFETFAHFIISFAATALKNAMTTINTGV